MPNPTLKALPPEKFDYWKAHHLLNRAGFGGTPAQIRSLADMGLEKAVDLLVEYERLPSEPMEADAFSAALIRPPTEEEKRAQQEAKKAGDEAALEKFQKMRNEAQQADRRQLADMKKWWLKRCIETGRPLEERMTLFWHGHFATGFRTIEDSWHMFMQNQLFREQATGNFGTLAHRIIRDPAMLRYLDNDKNRRQRPNENLARELMELFVMGEGKGYSEQDIKEGARALTGYTFTDDDFRMDKGSHDTGPKTILGKTGTWDGEGFVDILLATDFPSRFIAAKLYRYLVWDAPRELSKDRRQFVEALARRFRDSRHELKPLLKSLLRSEHFYDDSNVASLIKSPVQLIVQAVRSLRTPVRELSALASAADLMGQDLFQPPNVKGWDGGRAWINTSTLFVRQNVLIYLLTGNRPALYGWDESSDHYDARHLVEHLGPQARDPSAVTDYLLRFCLGRPPAEARRTTLLDFLRSRGDSVDNDRILACLCLITAMPEYQLC